MKYYKNFKKSKLLLILLLTLIVGASPAWGDAYTIGFETSEGWTNKNGNLSTMAEGWCLWNGTTTSTSSSIIYLYSTLKKSGTYSLYASGNTTPYYLITPKLAAGEISWEQATRSSSSTCTIAIYKATDNGDGTFAINGTALFNDSRKAFESSMSSKNCTLDEDSRLAILISRACIDDFTAANGLAAEDTGAIPMPTGFTNTSTTYNSATFSWTKGGEETAWQLVYDTNPDFNKDEATPVDITTNPYTLTGLSESTTYYAYLRAKDGDDVSSWTNKINFSTPAQYPTPTGLTVSGQTTTTATASWTAGSTETAWEISYSLDSDFSESTEVTSNSTSKGLTDLTANTTYYIKVRADYGSSHYSAWTDAISFKTLQEAQSADSWSDDFESENNWTLINGDKTNAWSWGTGASNGGSKGLYISNDGGTTNAYTNNSYTGVYASKMFMFSEGEYVISYDWLCNGESGWDFMRAVLVPADVELTAGNSLYSGLKSNAVPDGWIAIDGGSELSASSVWANKSVKVSIPSSANYYVAFAWVNDGNGGSNPPAAIDNFSIRLSDTPNPTNLSITDITAHAGTLNWDNTDNTWEVYHSTSSTTPAVDQTPTASPNTNSYTFTELTGNTKYYVWVRSVSKNNASYKSDWVGTNFTTDVAAVAPTGFAANNIGATGATLSWTAGADETKWDLVYGLYNDETDVRNTTVEVSSTPSKALTGLTSNTTYYAFVRAKKGEEVSSWVSTSFKTAYGVPFEEAFGTSSVPTDWARYGTWLTDDVLNGTTPLSTTTLGWKFGTSNSIFDSHAYVNVYGTNCDYWLVTPAIALGENQQLSFDLALTSYYGGAAATTGTDDKFIILLSTDNGTTWTNFAQWDNAGSARVFNDIATAGETVGLNLSSYDNQTVKFAFYVESKTANADNNLHIDNVSIDTAPSCVKPTDLAAANITISSAQLNWTSDGDRWDVRYRTTGDWTTVEGITTKPYTLTGLDSGTDYEIQVRNVCGISDFSDWSNSAFFTTIIAVDAEHPFTEDFNSGIPANWTKTTVSGTAWSVIDNKAKGGYTANAYLITPKIAVTSGMYLVFDQSYAYANDYQESSVAISTTGTDASDFTTIWTEEKANVNAASTKAISLEDYAGQNVHIAFKFNGSNAHYWYVDNVIIGMSATADEAASNTFTDGTFAVIDVAYTKAAESWGTIALPFATTTEELGTIYGATINAYKMKSFDGSELVFEDATTLEAGKPYVIYSPEAMSGTKTFYNKAITAAAGSDEKGSSSTVTFAATYAPITAGGMTGKYGVTPTGRVLKGGASATMDALRGYLTTSDPGARLSVVIEDETTGIKTILDAEDVFGNDRIYNLKGQQVENAKKGIFIINGKKVVRK